MLSAGGEPEILLRTENTRCGPAFMSIKATACVTINIIMQEGERAGMPKNTSFRKLSPLICKRLGKVSNLGRSTAVP